MMNQRALFSGVQIHYDLFLKTVLVLHPHSFTGFPCIYNIQLV